MPVPSDRPPAVRAATIRAGSIAVLAMMSTLGVAGSARAAGEPATPTPASADSADGSGLPQVGGAVPAKLARALAYEHGEGLPKDEKIAAALYCEAAVAGSAEGAFALGWMYANGRGVPRDDGTASALFDLAAKGGNRYAGLMLARLGGVHGLLPDCMRPPAPAAPDTQLADANADDDDGFDPFANLPSDKRKIADVVDRLAPRYGIEPRLALAIIAVESNFNAFARSVRDARGVMQLIPETAARFKVRNPYDVQENVRGGLAYLRWLLAYYRGEVALAAAAYNAGERVVDRYGGVPPYPETRDYVRRILALFRRARHPYDPAIAEPSIVAARSGTSSN